MIKITMGELREARSTDALGHEIARHLGKKESQFGLDHHSFIVRRCSLDAALRKVVRKTVRQRALYFSHFLRLAGVPGSTIMYYTLRRSYYGPIYRIMSTKRRMSVILIYGREAPSEGAGSYMKLSPVGGPLEFIAVHLLGLLPKTERVNQNVVVITDMFSKMNELYF